MTWEASDGTGVFPHTRSVRSPISARHL